jgi:hypothetical protein
MFTLFTLAPFSMSILAISVLANTAAKIRGVSPLLFTLFTLAFFQCRQPGNLSMAIDDSQTERRLTCIIYVIYVCSFVDEQPGGISITLEGCHDQWRVTHIVTPFTLAPLSMTILAISVSP